MRWAFVLCAACGRFGFAGGDDGATGDGRPSDGIGDGVVHGDGVTPDGSVPGGFSVQQAYVKASNTDANDDFGFALALSADGTTLAVGSFNEDSAATGIGGNQADNSAASAGAVYVFTRNGTAWTQQAYLKASNTGAGDYFGRSLALSGDGNTLAVGAPREDSAATGIGGNQADNSATDAGAVYVFVRAGAAWSQQAYVKASNTDAGDNFGGAVQLSSDGNTLEAAAIAEASAATGVNGNGADNSAAGAGAAYVFVRAGAAWSQQAYLKASNTDAGDAFGTAIALSGDGNTAAVGAEHEASAAKGIGGNQGDNSATDAGAVYVYARAGAVWSQQAYVKESNTDNGDAFGKALALSDNGDTLAAVGYDESSAATGVNGNQADNSLPYAGAVYVLVRAAGAWTQQAYIKASNPGNNDEFGSRLAISADGTTLVCGSFEEDSAATGIDGNQADNSATNAGAAYVFLRTGTAWQQQAYLKASNAAANDNFAAGLALSGDGAWLAIGAPQEDSAATGVGGNAADDSAMDSGAVYVFH